jgi:release factor glutamine methyltransferase
MNMSINELSIGAILTKTIPFLEGKKISNPRLEADLLLANVLNLPRVKLYSEWDRLLTPAEIQDYRELIVKRVQGWPLAYITGKKSFLSWDFTVTPAVLIPRPETELLIEIVHEMGRALTAEKQTEIQGIDVGTGSGVIAISLAKLLPGSTWHAVDISGEAIEVAQENAMNLGVASRIEFITGDLLEPLLRNSATLRKFDLIVANLPYISSSEIPLLQKEVQQEPKLALDGGNDGLELFRRLLPQALQLLADHGAIALEHGHDQRQALENILAESGLFTCQSLKDLAGIDRVLVAKRG